MWDTKLTEDIYGEVSEYVTKERGGSYCVTRFSEESYSTCKQKRVRDPEPALPGVKEYNCLSSIETKSSRDSSVGIATG
jgi:hypothetical protein